MQSSFEVRTRRPTREELDVASSSLARALSDSAASSRAPVSRMHSPPAPPRPSTRCARTADGARRALPLGVAPVLPSQQRGAHIALAKDATLYSATNIDITDAVLAALNQQLPSVQTVAPPPQQQQAPAAQPTQPAPTGR